MKKGFIILLTLVNILFVVSTVTAVPQVQSEPMMKVVKNIEQQRTYIEEKSETCVQDFTKISFKVQPKGIIDTLIALLKFLINLLNSIIQFLLEIITLGTLILALIEAITTLIDVIMQFIDWLMEIFNPEGFRVMQ